MRKFVIDPLLRYTLNDHIDIFSDISNLNWNIPSVKQQQSSFVGKVLRLAKNDIVKNQIWDVDNLGRMPDSLNQFFIDSIDPHMQERLIDAISQIDRINKNGLESLWKDIDSITLENEPELKDLFKVKKYIELLKFDGTDEDLFAKISEDKIFKFRFTEIERLISQREKIATNEKKAETPDEA